MRFTGRMLMVGLTGGIGAGKSAVSARLAELGAVVVDADRIAREVVAPGTDGLREVVAEFGTEVLEPSGALDRAALGRQVFGDDPARRRLEAIIHPRVRARTTELVAAAPADAIVVNDVPLLVETGLAAAYDVVVVVLAQEEMRVARLVTGRGMTRAEAMARIAAQATDDQRREVADVVIDNDGTLADLRDRVDRVWRDVLVPRRDAKEAPEGADVARTGD
jgi:dephospho-CoA kinase